jgi:hypothetical protein
MDPGGQKHTDPTGSRTLARSEIKSTIDAFLLHKHQNILD